MKRAQYRHLSNEEINILISQGCRSEHWDGITIHQSTDLSFIHNSVFSGNVTIGKTEKTHILPDGIPLHSGIYNSTLHNTEIGDNCLIRNNNGYISNYTIGEECIICRNGNIITCGESSFGQGTKLSVLCESGGREIIIHSKLSSHEAYLQAFYRHNPVLISRLHEAAMQEAEKHKSFQGHIGACSTVTGCQEIINVNIEEHSVINGATRLENGTVNSCHESPSYIGHNVIAKDFIMQYGSKLSDGCQTTRCFVGQASVIGHGFSATDSFFSCNCQAENGEACAIFAGPYTVTHHKSTLLIGGMYSFYNAGSGSNQSNHMYKLGPNHQGILERGCKTSSDSYLLWPARLGAFSMIMGHVTSQADTSELPFSYIIGEEGRNMIIPGIAIRNVGTLRDIDKWPKRDMRPDSSLHTDHITYSAYSPLTMKRILAGKNLLEQLAAADDTSNTNGGTKILDFRNMQIKHSAALRGIHLYKMAWHRYAGNAIANKLKEYEESSKSESLQSFMTPEKEYYDRWCDISGLISPVDIIEKMCKEISESPASSTHCIISSYAKRIHDEYDSMEWSWIWHNAIMPRLETEDIYEICTDIMENWRDATEYLNKAIADDARKEFSGHSLTGFGIDGDSNTAKSDFEAVRGKADTNPIIMSLEAGISDAYKMSSHYTGLLKQYKSRS